MKNVCIHGQHARVCRECELEEEITRLTKQRDELVDLLRCVETNLSKGMSKSIQKLQAQAIRAALAAVKEKP